MKTVTLMILGMMAVSAQAAPKKVYVDINCIGKAKNTSGINSDYAQIKLMVESIGMMRRDGSIADASVYTTDFVKKGAKLDYSRFEGDHAYGAPYYLDGDKIYSNTEDSPSFKLNEGQSYTTQRMVEMTGTYAESYEYKLVCFGSFMTKPHTILDNTNN